MNAIDYSNKINEIKAECKAKLINILDKMPNNTFIFHNENDIDCIVLNDNYKEYHRIKISSIRLDFDNIYVTDETTNKEYNINNVYSYWNRPMVLDLFDAIENEIDWLKDVMKDI